MAKDDLPKRQSGECMTIDDVCADSKLSRSKVYEEIREKRLKARKVGRATRVLRADYLKYLHALPASAA